MRTRGQAKEEGKIISNAEAPLQSSSSAQSCTDKTNQAEELPRKTKRDKKLPPKKRRKVDKAEECKNIDYDLNDCENTDTFKFLVEIFESVQSVRRKVEIRKYHAKINTLYLKNPGKDTKDLGKHQKLVATCIWRIMLPVFLAEKSYFSDALLKFLKNAMTGIGIQNEGEKESSSLFPLFYHILLFVIQFHADPRGIVRLRIMNLLKEILMHFETYEHPSFEILRNALLTDVIKRRIRDKISGVRAVTVLCLPNFKEDVSVRQLAQFYLSFDPNAEVRKAALIALPQFSSIKTSFYFKRAFDSSEAVRTEAYLRIAKLDFKRIANKSGRHKLIHWGLNQPSAKVRSIVEKMILPEWLKQCENSLLKLFSKLDLGAKSETGKIIIDALYPEGSTREFEEIDWSFLHGQKLIPLQELTLEKTQVWLLLCRKFKQSPLCVHRLIPEAVDVISYLKKFLDMLHERRARKNAEGEDEDDFSDCICFALILRFCEILDFEESARREMLKFLNTILLDPEIEDSIIVNAAVDLAAKLMDPDKLDEYIVNILKEFFEYNVSQIERNSQREQNSSNGTQMCSLEDEDNELNEGAAAMTIEDKPPQSGRGNAVSSPREGSLIKSRFCNPSNSTSPILNAAPDRPTKTQTAVQYTSTPIRPAKRQRVSVKLSEMKAMIAETILERHRFLTELDRASKKADYLECYSIQQKIDACITKEKEIKVQIEKLKGLDQMEFIDEAEEVCTDNARRSIIPEVCAISPVMSSSQKLSQSPAPPEEESVIISTFSILKALMMLLRFLNHTNKISSFLRSLYENHIIQCLEDEDSRVRAYTIYLYCYYGMKEKREAKRSMLISLQALQYDMQYAQVAGFKSAVDLLLCYPLETFLPKLSSTLNVGIDDIELPPPFDDPRKSAREAESGLIDLLCRFGGENPTDPEKAIQISGLTKLFLSGRIKNVPLLAEFLCLWINPSLGASPVCYHVGNFIPLYCLMDVSNSNRVLEAFVICVKKISACQERKEDDTTGLANADVMKLAEFVTTNTVGEALARFTDAYVIHERQVLNILQFIKENVEARENVNLARSMKYFAIKQPRTAAEMKRSISEIFDSIAELGNFTGASALKTSLRAFVRQLEKNFDLEAEAWGEDGEEDDNDLDVELLLETKGISSTGSVVALKSEFPAEEEDSNDVSMSENENARNVPPGIK